MTVVELTLTREVPATPPKVTKVVLPRLVPAIVTDVPPAVVPMDGVIDVIVLVVASIVSSLPSATAVVLLETLVFTVNPAFATLAAAGLTIPAMVSVPIVPLASAHVPPLLVSDAVTVWIAPIAPVVAPVAEQVTKPAVSAIVGTAGIANPAGKTTVTVFAPDKAEEILKLTVHVVCA